MVAMTKIEGAQQAGPVRRWSVVVSHPQAEKWAKDNLENQGFEVYLPFAVSGKPVTVKNPKGEGLDIRPLFPRYLFVRLDPDFDMWRRIFSTRGCSAIFSTGDRPLAVPDRIIDEIRGREEAGFIKMMSPEEAPGRGFRLRQPVTLATPNGDLDALFLEPIDKTRAAILFNLLGREVRAVVTLTSLK